MPENRRQKFRAMLQQSGSMGVSHRMLTSFAERQRLVGIAAFQDIEQKYK